MSAKPTHLSRIPRGTDISVGDLGASMLGLPLFPQGKQVAGLMEARGRGGQRLYTEVGVQEPRRSTKTTSIWAVLIGRCATIPGYQVITTAQDGTRASAKIREHMSALEANGFEDGMGDLYWSNGQEKIRFANRSLIWTVAPKPSAFRSSAADAILLDEAGEMDPDVAEALLAGALPLMDTRPDPQVIITGTPSLTRSGLLWHTLQDGRAGKPGTGILDYSIRDDESLAIVDEDGTVRLNVPLLKRVHPGVGSDAQFRRGECLTTVTRMRQRFEKMQLPQFEREYGGRFGFDNTTSAIDADAWAGAYLDFEDRPDRVGIAFDCAVDGSSATIAYAWRIDGVAYVEVVAHQAGTTWVARESHKASQKWRRIPVGYDSIGANLDPGQALTRLRPTPKTQRYGTKDVMGAAQRLVAELHDGNLRHFGQKDLDAAVTNTSWRNIANSGRAFGKKDPNGPAVNPLVACSLALWGYDAIRDRQPLTIAV